MDLRLDGDAALVTASSSGLGRSSAKALAREGANVVINGRDEERLAAAAAELREVATGEVVAQAGDITDPADVEALVERTVEAFGGIDRVVTSAGGPPPMRAIESDDDAWYETYDLLVMSVLRLVRAAAPHLRADGGGSVVTITSMAAKRVAETNVLSSSVRPAVVGLEKVLSRELAPEVRCNAVLPGAHDTRRIRELFEAEVARGERESVEEARARRAATIPLGVVGDPDAFGDAVAFLCSERAEHINGVALPIDGGASSSIF